MKHGSKDYGSKGSSLKEGVSKKQSFTPESQSPSETRFGGRPKHDNPKVKRHNTSIPKI